MQVFSSRNTLFTSKSDTERKLCKTIWKYSDIDMPKVSPSVEKKIKGISMRKGQGFLAEVLTELILKECACVSRQERWGNGI